VLGQLHAGHGGKMPAAPSKCRVNEPECDPGTSIHEGRRRIPSLVLFLPTEAPSYRALMIAFEVRLRDGSVEHIRDADGYQPEGALTTFFRFGSRRGVIDAWSTRVASVRTADIVVVRRSGAVTDEATAA
jgi:hypothetical protein